MDRLGGPPLIYGRRVRVYVRLAVVQINNAFNVVVNLLQLNPPLVGRILYILTADSPNFRYTLPDSDDWGLDSSSSPGAHSAYTPVASESSLPLEDPSLADDVSASYPSPTERSEEAQATLPDAFPADSFPGEDLAPARIQDRVYISAGCRSVGYSELTCTSPYVNFGLERCSLDAALALELDLTQYLVMASVLIFFLAKCLRFCKHGIKLYRQIVENYTEGEAGRSVPDHKPAKDDLIDNLSDIQQSILATDDDFLGHHDVATIDQPTSLLQFPRQSGSAHAVLFPEERNQVLKSDLSNGLAATSGALPWWNSSESQDRAENQAVPDDLDILDLEEPVNWMIDAIGSLFYKIAWHVFRLAVSSFKKPNAVPRFLIFVVLTIVEALSSLLSTAIMLCKWAITGSSAVVVAGVWSLGGLICRICVVLQAGLVRSALTLGDALPWPFGYMRWKLLVVVGARRMHLSIPERSKYQALDNLLVVDATKVGTQTPGHRKFLKQGIKILRHVFFPAWDEEKRAQYLAQGTADYCFDLILSSNQFATLVEAKGPFTASGEELSGSSHNFHKYDFSLHAIRSLSLSGPAFDALTCAALFKHTLNVQKLELGNISDLAELLSVINTHDLLPNLAELVLTGKGVNIVLPIGFLECRRLISELNRRHGREGLKLVKLVMPHGSSTGTSLRIVHCVNVKYCVAPGTGGPPVLRGMGDKRMLVPYQLLKERLEPEVEQGPGQA